MKPIKIAAIIVLVIFSLSWVNIAEAGLWTDFKKSFKNFYTKFKKDAKESGKEVKRIPRKSGGILAKRQKSPVIK